MNIRDFKVLLDKRVYHNLEGQWRDLFARLKWDTVKSALKSVAGLQGRKFKVTHNPLWIPLRIRIYPTQGCLPGKTWLMPGRIAEACQQPAVGACCALRMQNRTHQHRTLRSWLLLGSSAVNIAEKLVSVMSRTFEVPFCHAGVDAWDVCRARQQR